MARTIWLATAGISALVAGSPALAAQTPAQGDQVAAAPAAGSRTAVYGPEFFAGFAPRTALDIARRVPGFQLDLGNVDIRGFAGAAGNVVINGARPSSKAESIEATLQRIPAMRVARVEVGPGDLYGAEYSGKNQVLNIILSAAGGVDGNATLSARRIWTGRIVPSGSASALIKRGASTINLSAGSQYSFQSEEGTDTLVDAATGELLEVRRKFNDYEDFNPYVSGSWALERAADRAIRVNARWSPGQFDLVQRNRVTPADGPRHDDSLVQDYDSPVFELGADITRPLAGGAIKLVGLATRRERNNFDAYFGRAGLGEDGPVVGGFEQTQKAKRNETIGRLTWSRQNFLGFSLEAGGEAALNTLDSNVDLFLLGPDGAKTRIDLLVDSATVKEKRTEVFVNLGKTLSPALRVDAGLTFESSRLKVRGDAIADRSLKFLKPNATIDWKIGRGWHSQFSVRRSVAQLDFYDFISAAELSNDRVNAGNANLLPQRAWEFRLTVDRPIFKEGLIKLEMGRDIISLLQDRVLIFDEAGKGFDAPGNIGTGRRSFARLTVDAPLGWLWSGLRLKSSGQLQRTRVEDPISGEKRNFSGFYPDWEWNVDLRRDAGQFSYGFLLENRDRFTFFRTDEFDANFNNGAYATAFVEYRPDARTAITFDLDNALDNGASRGRLLFFPNRASPEAIEDELRERNRHVSVGLTIKRSFGGGGGNAAAAASAQ
jgi:hypothetical protein